MRDPDRIDRILQTLREAWMKTSDLRLGQLMINAIRPVNPACPKLFYIEDDTLEDLIRRFPLGIGVDADEPLKEPEPIPMTHELALEILRQTRATRFTAEWEDVVAKAIAYARIRVDWLRADSEKQRWLGSERATCHNALIAACDLLSSKMTEAGEDISWRYKLGNDRKTIGDFACHLHCILGLIAR